MNYDFFFLSFFLNRFGDTMGVVSETNICLEIIDLTGSFHPIRN